MLKVGLTGAIGSGKSLAASFFDKLGVPIIDADLITQQLIQPNSHALKAIVKHFGNSILFPDKTLNKNKLKTIIFTETREKKWLESLLHPTIQATMLKQIKTIQAPYTILVIPLLIEKQAHQLVDKILLIDAPDTLCIQRICKRDHITPAFAKQILASQATKAERLAYADNTIINNQTIEALGNAVLKLHQMYLTDSP